MKGDASSFYLTCLDFPPSNFCRLIAWFSWAKLKVPAVFFTFVSLKNKLATISNPQTQYLYTEQEQRKSHLPFPTRLFDFFGLWWLQVTFWLQGWRISNHTSYLSSCLVLLRINHWGFLLWGHQWDRGASFFCCLADRFALWHFISHIGRRNSSRRSTKISTNEHIK